MESKEGGILCETIYFHTIFLDIIMSNQMGHINVVKPFSGSLYIGKDISNLKHDKNQYKKNANHDQ